MNNRPTSVTVISWILIVLGGISLITTTSMLDNPMVVEMMSKNLLPVSVQYAMAYIGLLVSIVAGVAMLKGHSWARLLYVIWSVIGFLVGALTSPMKLALVPGLVVFLIIAFFLFRPKPNEYFSSVKTPDNA